MTRYTIDCSRPTKRRTMKSKSLVIVDANASAKPAKEASILDVIKHTKAVAPTTPADSKLKRTDNHLFTTGGLDVRRWVREREKDTYLPTSSNKDLSSGRRMTHQKSLAFSSKNLRYPRSVAYLAKTWKMHRKP